MQNKTSFYKAPPKTIIFVLALACFFAVLVPFIISAGEHYMGRNIGSPQSYKIFAPVAFCACLGFYDDKYTGLRIIGTLIGAITGVLFVILNPTETLIAATLYSLVMGSMFAFMGYFMVGYNSIFLEPWHW